MIKKYWGEFLSSKSTTPTPTILERELLIKSLEQPLKLAELVKRLEDARKDEAQELLRGTTKSGFRKVHERVASAIDNSAEIFSRVLRMRDIEKTQDYDKTIERAIDRVSLVLAQTLIFVNYQEARGQLGRELAHRINDMIKQLLERLTEVRTTKSRENVDKLLRTLESMRTIMDALLVVAYRYAR